MQINLISHFDNLSFHRNQIEKMTNDAMTSKEISNHRVLILNANQYSQEIQSQFLEDMGFIKIDYAEQDTQLEQLINKNEYSIIIFEVISFNQKALTFCNLIRNSQKNKNTLLLAATYINEDIFGKCIEFGINGLIIKPFIYSLYKKALCFYLSKMSDLKIKSIY